MLTLYLVAREALRFESSRGAVSGEQQAHRAVAAFTDATDFAEGFEHIEQPTDR